MVIILIGSNKQQKGLNTEREKVRESLSFININNFHYASFWFFLEASPLLYIDSMGENLLVLRYRTSVN
jgi:hypothetical protein